MVFNRFSVARRYGTSLQASGTCGQQPDPVSGRIGREEVTRTRAAGAWGWEPWVAAAPFGAAALIRAASWSTPPLSYLSRHGWPNGLADAQFSMIEVNPMSLPPIDSDATCVEALSALCCGGWAR